MSEQLTALDPVEIILADGKPRHLLYSLGSLRRLKKKYGQSLMTPEAVMAMDEETIPSLIFEGLREKDGIASDDDVADLLDMRQLKHYVDAFSEAFNLSQPPEKNVQSPAA